MSLDTLKVANCLWNLHNQSHLEINKLFTAANSNEYIDKRVHHVTSNSVPI